MRRTRGFKDLVRGLLPVGRLLVATIAMTVAVAGIARTVSAVPGERVHQGDDGTGQPPPPSVPPAMIVKFNRYYATWYAVYMDSHQTAPPFPAWLLQQRTLHPTETRMMISLYAYYSQHPQSPRR